MSFTSTRIFPAALAAVCSLLSHSPAARAGDDSTCESSLSVFPTDGATDVPLRPLISVETVSNRDYTGELSDDVEVALIDSDGQVVPLDAILLERDCGLIFQPAKKLAPNAPYTVAVGEDLDEYHQTFTTTEVSEPVAPTLQAGDDDPDKPGLQVELEWSDDVIALTYAGYLESGLESVVFTPKPGKRLQVRDSILRDGTLNVTAWNLFGQSSTVTLVAVSDDDSSDDDHDGPSADAGQRDNAAEDGDEKEDETGPDDAESDGSGCAVGPRGDTSMLYLGTWAGLLALLVRRRRFGSS